MRNNDDKESLKMQNSLLFEFEKLSAWIRHKDRKWGDKFFIICIFWMRLTNCNDSMLAVGRDKRQTFLVNWNIHAKLSVPCVNVDEKKSVSWKSIIFNEKYDFAWAQETNAPHKRSFCCISWRSLLHKTNTPTEFPWIV